MEDTCFFVQKVTYISLKITFHILIEKNLYNKIGF